MRGTGLAEAICWLFEIIYENLKHEPRQVIHMEKPLETIRWGRASGNHQGRTKSVGHVDGLSDVAPACWFCGSVGGRLRKGVVASASTSV